MSRAAIAMVFVRPCIWAADAIVKWKRVIFIEALM